MSNKQPIPIPAAQRWQDFRQILLPLIVFSLCILGLGLLWWNKIAPSTVVGEARSDNIVISSPRAGLLKEVHVGRFDEIKMGEPIAEVDYSTDPNFVDAQVEWVRAQVDLLTLTIDPVQRARTTLDYNQLRLDWLNERTTLAALKIEFENSEREYQRIAKLFKDQLVSESVYNKAQTDRDSYKVRVEEKTGLVSSIEQSLREAQDSDPASQLDKVRIEKLDESLARVEELLNGGSIYWIIKGVMSARQAIIDFVEAERADGRLACGIVLSPEIVTVAPTRMRIFQGWRYLEVADAPIDIGTENDENMPSEFFAELRELGIF